VTPIAKLRRGLDALDAPPHFGVRDRRGADDWLAIRQTLFSRAQEPGRIAMLDGGDQNPVALIIETGDGHLVRVTLTSLECRHLAAQLITLEGP
jgi:hypothetical protein